MSTDLIDTLKSCPKCSMRWPPVCEQTICIDLHGECIRCRFVDKGPRNQHGSGEGIRNEITAISDAIIAANQDIDDLLFSLYGY